MKITAVKTGVLETPLKVPFKTAVRSVEKMTDVVVKIETDTETVGWGSAPPTAKVTGDTIGSITGAVHEVLSPLMLGRQAGDLEENLDIIEGAIIGNTSAKAAMDIALHDLWARTLNAPIWKLFGGSGKMVATDVTVSVNSPKVMAQDAVRAVSDGFKVLKIKVGVDADADFLRLCAVRAAIGREAKIRIDANQGWRPSEAVRLLNRMQDRGLDIELVEQPVRAADIKGLAYVTSNSPIPVVADESCWSPKDAIELLSQRAASIINIKLMKCGGLRQARRIIAAAQAYGAEVMIGCMLEGKISCAAAVHLASAYSCITRVDLDGPVLASADYVQGGPIFDGGSEIRLTDAPGFGIKEAGNVIWHK